MADFDERSSTVTVDTNWGSWFQTIDEVFVEIDVNEGTRGKDVKCDITSKKMRVTVLGKVVIEGEFPKPVHADEVLWTLEDKKLVRICLPKAEPSASNCWHSLLVGQYEANLFQQDEMQKKLTLQRFQYEVKKQFTMDRL
ncbi:nudC domain-containing protein 2-like isoform X2 [Lineus longissimus]|uniref:nudC domain-containing protein 2-like isoform X2 n=1 Tax=Lineus longissimus TaxID=88925 RepID=UPI00315CF5CE